MSDSPPKVDALDPNKVHPAAPDTVDAAVEILCQHDLGEGYSFSLAVYREGETWRASLSRSGGPGRPDCWDSWRGASSPALALRNLAGTFVELPAEATR